MMTHVSYDSNEFASEDDAQLAAHGYVSSFKREFSNLATISFAFAIMVGMIMDWISTGTTPTFLFPGHVFQYCHYVQHSSSARGTRFCSVVLDYRSQVLFGNGI